MSDFECSVQQLKERLDRGDDFVLLDVREPHEFEIARIGEKLIPLRQIPHRLDELDREKEIVVYCHHGSRSFQATMYLRQQGFTKAKNLTGGIDAWSLVIDPSVPRY